jgi:hypothetical protein
MTLCGLFSFFDFPHSPVASDIDNAELLLIPRVEGHIGVREATRLHH